MVFIDCKGYLVIDFDKEHEKNNKDNEFIINITIDSCNFD